MCLRLRFLRSFDESFLRSFDDLLRSGFRVAHDLLCLRLSLGDDLFGLLLRGFRVIVGSRCFVQNTDCACAAEFFDDLRVTFEGVAWLVPGAVVLDGASQGYFLSLWFCHITSYAAASSNA
ncbi:hypothetical protein Z045_05730 [Rhodococcus pyridinivorans KG-16]|uniref:Uncharacterized protein n=1 Tax=Rhodococcus pyridinivorans KG-16 TaxID=1441730 RepID=A0A0V9UNV0_9NOCA|nr:hypothetical protein Z045_05730 [Rhodococcus pyridinivorans KG-16]